MNDIERQIEGIEKEDNEQINDIGRGDEVISNRKKNGDNNNNKLFMLVICGVLGLIIVGLLLYIFLGNKDENLSSDNNENDLEVGEVNGEINESDDEIILENMGYVSCDDNTAPLDVRNSSTGNIIESLSCYK